jgi:hypothetical protein
MNRIFKNLFSPTTTKQNVRPTLKPQMESLETREVPAAYISGGNLMLVGSNYDDYVTVNNYNASYSPSEKGDVLNS